MKRLACALFVLAGCAPSSTQTPPGDAPDELKFEMGIASQIAFDITKLKRGEKSMYAVRLLGKTQPDYVKYAVVDDDATSIWIENTVPADPRPFVIKSRYDRTNAKLLERWAGEAGSAMPAKLYTRDGRKDEGAPQRDTSRAQADFKEEVDPITVAGKTWTATRVTTTLTYPGGRKSVLTDWYHKDVPFSVVIENKRSLGGLLKRQFGRLTMELVTWEARGARAELEIPR